MTIKTESHEAGGGRITTDNGKVFIDIDSATLAGQFKVGVSTDPALPAFSATPEFDCAASNVFEPEPMTANITAMTLVNMKAGQTVQIRFQQDATGGKTVALPVDSKIDGYLATAANAVTWLVMTYSARAARWEGNYLQVPA